MTFSNTDAPIRTQTLRILNSRFALEHRYKDYIHTYEERISHLRRKIKQKSNWGKFCEGQKQTHGLDIFSLMIQPVQRMPRYRLLILELLKSTPDDATYRDSLKDALSNLERALEISNGSA